MKFSNRKEQRKVNEVMASLLVPLKNHVNDETKMCIELTLRALQELDVEQGDTE